MRALAAGLLVAAAFAAPGGAASPAAEPAKAGAVTSPGQDAIRRAEGLRTAGNFSEAIALLRDAAAREPKNPTLLFVLGNYLLRARDFAAAAAALQAGLALAPHSLNARRALAQAQWGKGDLAAARATLESLWRDAPTFTPAGEDLAGVLAAQGDRAGAIQTFRHLIDTAGPQDDPRRLARWHAGLAKVLEAEGDKPGALAAYQEAARLDPKNPPAQSALKRLAR
jgi:tetratricopeptide (TPR) repeat protein